MHAHYVLALGLVALELVAPGHTKIVRAQSSPPGPSSTTSDDEERLARERAAREASSELFDLRVNYARARHLFGEPHVALVPLLTSSWRCDDAIVCDDSDSRLQVAGGLFVPVWGAGGNRPSRFFPPLETDDEARAYMRFEQHARDLARNVTTAAEITGTSSLQRIQVRQDFDLLASTFRAILEREVEAEGSYADLASDLLKCLDTIDRSGASTQEKIQQLDALWREWDYRYGSGHFKRRHSFMAGAFLGTPFADEIGRELLVGLMIELGGEGWGVSLAGGARLVIEPLWFAPDPAGLWIGVGFGGEVTQDIFNSISGAQDVASLL